VPERGDRGQRGDRSNGGAIAGAIGVAVVCAWAAWGVIASEGGCQLQGACDPETIDPGPLTDKGAPTGAGMYGDRWQSSPIEGTWAWFPGQRTYVVHPPFKGPYTFPQIFLSADANPYSTDGSNFAASAGNTAEISDVNDDLRSFKITNNTCSPYYLWLQVAPQGQADGAVPEDGGADAAVPEDGGADGAVPDDGSADGAVQSRD
jgi:hypothetical protein